MNKPDTYEAAAFQRLAGLPAQRPSDAVLSEFVEKEQSVRVMLPLFNGKACLACHGEPKGNGIYPATLAKVQRRATSAEQSA
jgi:general secretion pathway protein A